MTDGVRPMKDLVLLEGVSLKDKKPVRITMADAHEHHYAIRGKTGAGKDQRCVLPIVTHCQQPFFFNGQVQKAGLAVLDAGDDLCLHWGTKAAADTFKRIFRLATSDSNAASSSIKLFPEDLYREGNLAAVGASLAAALGAPFEFAYGPFYFATQQIGAIVAGLNIVRQTGKPLTVTELKKVLGLRAVRQVFPDAGGLQAVLTLLEQYPALTVSSPAQADIINPEDAVLNGETHYYHFPTLMDPGAKVCLSIIMQSYVAAAKRLHAEGKRGLLFLVVEEASSLMGPAFGSMLAQLRKLGVIVVMSFQTSSQLITKDCDLRPDIQTNTNRIYLSCTTDDDIRELQLRSKERPFPLETRSTGLGAFDCRSGEHDIFRPILDKNKILDVSETPGAAFLLRDHDRHVEPEQVFYPFFLPYEQYDLWAYTPLPRKVRSATELARETERAQVLANLKTLFTELNQEP